MEANLSKNSEFTRADISHDLVSIVTPSYKSYKFISQTIESVIAQTHENWEMIIVDDLSPDNSNEIIEAYTKKDQRIKLVKLEKNSGAAVARNRAIEVAEGRYIAFLDADDLWKPEKLEKQIKFMIQNDLVFTYSSYDLIDETGKKIGNFKARSRTNYNDLLKTNSIGCLTAIYDAEKIGKQFMPLVLRQQDYGLWLKILRKKGETLGILEPLAIYRILNNSLSSNKKKAALDQWKIYRDVENIGLFKSAYYFFHYVYNGYKKYKLKWS